MRSKKRLKKEVLIIFLIPLLIGLSIFFFILSNKTKVSEILSYTEKSNIDYQVCLKENTFYEERCQPKGMKYIASAIEEINVVFDYTFEISENVKYTSEYYIDAIITVLDRNDSSNVLFTKTIKFLDTKTKSEENHNIFNINEKLKIDYHEYNDLVRSFKSEYNISADSILKLKLYINTTVDYVNFKNQIERNDEMELTIPLTENTINIDMNYKKIHASDEFVETENKTTLNKIYFIISMLFVSTSVISLFILGVIISKKKNNVSGYEKFINNKIKNLDRLIVSAKDNIKINEEDYLEIIDVKSFNELVDIAERLVDVITWTEVTNESEKTSWFAIANDKRLYRIIYKSTDSEFM